MKIFCVGRNKTGTTSLTKAFQDLDFKIGNQTHAEELFDKHFFKNEFEPILKYCETAEFFQDIPFSYLPTVFKIDERFPNSKFILTIRSTAEEWYNSLVRFHSKLFGKDGRIPNYEDLENAEYLRKGFMLHVIEIHGTTIHDPYNKKIMINHYNNHNNMIIKYFKHRPNDLLVINLAHKDSYPKFLKFLNIDSIHNNFPWENKT